ncbi:MAG: helix-turn-helix transcriptional regulator [Lachnospiraceae bacterium]|nr:helix-turn-helix transcriptional regulator [Lachnospiraceae bacterium]
MKIHAYDELYLANAQNVLGHALDFAIMTLELSPEAFEQAFVVSHASKQFGQGNPAYVAGLTGCEFAREVLAEVHFSYEDAEDVMYLDKSPEYWAGWALAYYQWECGLPFSEILSSVSFSELIEMYPLYHEMDLSHFVEEMYARHLQLIPQTRLSKLRKNAGLSQSQLAKLSGVSLRQIQLFEQRQREINKASAFTLLQLSKALHCHMEDLLEFI